jgi:hypothetical protein
LGSYSFYLACQSQLTSFFSGIPAWSCRA